MRHLTSTVLVILLTCAACAKDPVSAPVPDVDAPGSGSDAPLPGPTAPSNLRVAKLGAGGHLTWTDNSSNETEFMIMRKAGAGAFSHVTSLTANMTQYHDEPLTTGTVYIYTVTAINADGDSVSNEATYTH